MQIALLVLIGLPAAGKTTLALSLIDRCSKFRYLHYCYDDIALHNKYSTQDKSFRTIRLDHLNDIDVLIKSIQTRTKDTCPHHLLSMYSIAVASEKPVVIIVDDNMYYRSMRYSVYNTARNNNVGFCQLYLNASMEQSLTVNSERNSQQIVPNFTIENIMKKLQIPNLSLKWEKHSLTVPAYVTIENYADDLSSLISVALNAPEQPKAIDNRSIQEITSIIHSVDNALRKIVASKMKAAKQEMDSNDFKKLSHELCQKKKEFMHNVRAGHIHLPVESELPTSELIEFINDTFLL